MATETYHISSLILQGRPRDLTAIRRAVLGIPGTEVHAVSPQGKIVVTLETADEQDIVERMRDINLIEGVFSASLVYHQVDEG